MAKKFIETPHVINRPIGIIDSGVGGLTIAKAIIKKLPNEPIIYIADSQNCPYGEKSNAKIYNLTKKMVDFLLRKNIKILIVACNTITVTSIDKLRKNYPQIPIVGIVPVVKKAAELSKNRNIGIYSTLVTANSKYQKELIKKYSQGFKVTNIGSSKLVPLIESLDLRNIDKTLKQELKVFKQEKIDTLALGCSHFPFIKNKIQKQLPRVLILESSGAVARQVKKILVHNKILSKLQNPNYNFYTTGDIKIFEHFVNKLTTKGKIERISLQ